MIDKYEHILSPIKLGSVSLKSRLLNSKCVPSSLNDMDALGCFYENFARKGAATVTMAVGSWPDCEGRRSKMSPLDMEDPQIQAAFSDIVKRCHKHGTLCGASLMSVEPQYVAISDTPNWNEIPKDGDYSRNFSNKHGISLERLEGMINDIVFQCEELKRMGFDMVTIYMSYRGSILACSLSPVLNQRTDKYGGPTMKERATLSLEVFRRIKEACGQDFIIEVQISAVEEEPGYTLEEFLDYAQLCEGLVDIFQLRGYEGSTTHVNGYIFEKDEPLNLKYAEAFKKRGIKALVSPVGGFIDLELIDKWIAEGKTDCVSIARGFICDEDYDIKLNEGRGADMTPCLLCNGCHGGTCSVNPKAGYLHLLSEVKPAARSKKVAIIGGGPAGLRAAIIADSRGHKVTLFEKSGALGGQLKLAEYPAFKWPLNNYKKWLIRETEKSGVEVKLNTAATPALIKEGEFDAVILALGSKPEKIPVPGAEKPFIRTVDSVYGHEKELGENVVVIGGQASGRETALYLAECGHKVTMLTRGNAALFDDAHAKLACEKRFLSQPNFSYIEHASTLEIGDGFVMAEIKHGMPVMNMEGGGRNGPVGGFDGAQPGDSDFYGPEPPPFMDGPGGQGGTISLPQALNFSTMNGRKPPEPKPASPEHGHMFFGMMGGKPDESKITVETRRIEFDSIVVSGGRAPLTEEAKAFQALAPEVYIIGDNVTPGDVRDCTANAYAAAMAL